MELGYANGSIAKSSEKIQAYRLKAIADYFGVSMEYILTGETDHKYLFDDEIAAKVNELFDNPNIRILFDAAKDSSPEDLHIAAYLLERLKGIKTNG